MQIILLVITAFSFDDNASGNEKSEFMMRGHYIIDSLTFYVCHNIASCISKSLSTT